jgi:hypothetical protein
VPTSHDRAFKRASLFNSQSILCGALVWACRALNSQNTAVSGPARAGAEAWQARRRWFPGGGPVHGPAPPGAVVRALRVPHSESALCGAFVWACRALSGPKPSPLARALHSPRAPWLSLSHRHLSIIQSSNFGFWPRAVHVGAVGGLLGQVPGAPGEHRDARGLFKGALLERLDVL